MFESKDMLPRPPPVPSAPPSTINPIPTVPEVSIIFGKPTKSETENEETPPTYAEWKKKNLPRLTFPPSLSDELNHNTKASSGYITTRSSVFPFRTVTVPTTAGSTYSNNICMSDKVPSNPLLELTTPPSSFGHSTYRSEQRRSIDSLAKRSQTIDAALTICASTQTDVINSSGETTSEAFKQQFTELIDIMKELREEQHQMRQVMETLLQQQQQSQQQQQQQAQLTLKVFYSDKSTQYENDKANELGTASLENVPPFTVDNSTLHHALPNVKIYSTTAQEASLVSQPLTYRVSSPINTRQNGAITTQSNNPYVQNIQTLPNASSDRSMVMNELARKYLPSDKLNELMQDAQITTVANGSTSKRPVPLRENDNFNRAPTDISNASYKYLRKYRLLPDENRNSPNHNRMQSPPVYQQKLQDPPRACNGGSSGAANGVESQHLDFDHIRRQPKFL